MAAKAVRIDRNAEDFQAVADSYARRVLESIRVEVAALEHARECKQGDCKFWEDEDGHRLFIAKTEDPESFHDEERARERITEGPLSVEVRGDWHTPGDEQDAKPTEYNILLGTGGPAARIVGDLSQHSEPESAHFEYQDWFKPWTRANLSGAEEDILLKYAQEFYFG